jgi:hypothetical protein
MLNGAMNVAVTNVTLTSSPIVAVINATPNQPRNVIMTHAFTNVARPSVIIA